jgi:hypothetical protein
VRQHCDYLAKRSKIVGTRLDVPGRQLKA